MCRPWGGFGAQLSQGDAVGVHAVEQADAVPEEHGGEGEMELVDQARVEALQDRVGAAGDADVPAAGRLAGPVECAADAVIDEVERGAALPLPRVASLVRHDEHRRVERRVLGPGVLAGVEHALAHHVRAGAVEGPGHDVVVATLLAAGTEV